MGFIDYLSSGWLNKTYEYLKKSGGGPTYPPSKSLGTLGAPRTFTEEELAAVQPGSYSILPDGPIVYTMPQEVKIPFNAGNIGIVPYQANKADSVAEIAHEMSTPNVLSKAFAKLFPNMTFCVQDQMHGHNNPCAGDACREFAETGDSSRMMLDSRQKEKLGITSVVKPDDVQAAENKSNATFTEQISQGVRGLNTWGKTMMDAMTPAKGKGIITDAGAGFPEGVNFTQIKKGIAGILPSTPQMGGYTTLLLIGGGVLLLVLLIRR